MKEATTDYLHDITIESGKEEVIHELNRIVQLNSFVFRGHSKEIELFPKIYREANYTKYEMDFLSEFEKYGSQYFHASTPIDFMSCAQHYGIPTRLLDFTYNPFIALAFALYSEKGTNYKNVEEKDYYFITCVNYKTNYRIEKFSIKKYSTIGSSDNPDSLSERSKVIIKCANDGLNGAFFVEEFEKYRERYNNRILLIDPSKSNQRITVQQGLFMFPMDLDKEVHMQLLKEQSFRIRIHKSLRTDLLDYLNAIGFNTYRLMPDLMSVCDAITKNVKKNRTISVISSAVEKE